MQLFAVMSEQELWQDSSQKVIYMPRDAESLKLKDVCVDAFIMRAHTKL